MTMVNKVGMINAGKYDRRISIYQLTTSKDAQGFKQTTNTLVLKTWASVKTTKGFTLIANNSDFEKAFTNFTIRYSQKVVDAYYNEDNSNRDMTVEFRNKVYEIVYLNNVDEANVELEIQAKEVKK